LVEVAFDVKTYIIIFKKIREKGSRLETDDTDTHSVVIS
jgi:hypothetical protein